MVFDNRIRCSRVPNIVVPEKPPFGGLTEGANRGLLCLVSEEHSGIVVEGPQDAGRRIAMRRQIQYRNPGLRSSDHGTMT